MSFRSIAIDGPIGVGKTALAERLAARLDGTTILEERENPFLPDFYKGRPGAALQAQLFYLLNRHQQQTAQRQSNLFAQVTHLRLRVRQGQDLRVSEPGRQRAVHLSAALRSAGGRHPDTGPGDLSAGTDRGPRKRGSTPARPFESPTRETLEPDADYLRELNEAYQHFFFHYTATPLLVVETSQVELHASDDALEDLVRQITTMGKGTRYYVPRP